MSLTEDQFKHYWSQLKDTTRAPLFDLTLVPLILEVPIIVFMIAPEHLEILRPVIQFARDEKLNTTKTLRALGIPKTAMKVPVDFCDEKMANAVRVLDASTFSQTLPKDGANARIWAAAILRFTKSNGPGTTLRWIAKHAVELRAQYPNDAQMLDAIDYLYSTEIHRSTSILNVMKASQDYHDGNLRRNYKAEMIRRMSARDLESYCRADAEHSSALSEMMRHLQNRPIGSMGPLPSLTRDEVYAYTRTGRFRHEAKQFAVEVQAAPGEENRIIFPELGDDLDGVAEIGGFQFVRLTTQSEFKKEGYWDGHNRLNCIADGRYYRLACEGDCMIISCRKGGSLIGSAEISPELGLVQFRSGKHEVTDNQARKALLKLIDRLAEIPKSKLLREPIARQQIDYARTEQHVLGMDLLAGGLNDMTDASIATTQAMDRLHREMLEGTSPYYNLGFTT